MSAPLGDDDKAFIRTILNNPAELTGWLAYIDWLEEHGDPRAEFVRLQIQLLTHDRRRPEPFEIHKRLEELRPSLDPDWVAVFNRSPIENCDDEFAFRCPKKWEHLKGTDNPRERYCDTCDKKVYFCLTAREAKCRRDLGLCVALSEEVRFPHGQWSWRDQNPQGEYVALGRLRMPDPRPEPEPEAEEPESEEPRRPWWKFW